MAIRVRCPRCWETAEVAEEHLGRQGKCNSCGAMVQIPSKLTKVCFICGTDVTVGRHAKDPDNNYLCLSCFDARNPQQKAIFSVPSLECSVCHAKFALGDGFERAGEPVCKDCHHRHVGDDDDDEAPPPVNSEPAGRNEDKPPQPQSRHDEARAPADEHAQADALASSDKSDMDAHVSGFEESGGSGRTRTVIRTRSSSFGLAVSVVSLLAIVGLAYLQPPGNRAEDELRLRVATLKAQAEVLVSLGRPQQGLDKYGELARLVNGRAIHNEDLRREIQAAQAAAEQVAQASPADWEQEHLLKIIVLKSQADLLKALGHAREANDRYREITQLAAGRAVRSTLLAEEVAAARAAIDRNLAQATRATPTLNGQAPVVSHTTSQPVIAQIDPAVVSPIETADPSIFADPPDPTPPTSLPAVTTNTPPPTTRERPPLKSIFDD